MSFAVGIHNGTPFSAATHVQLDADGQEVLVVMFSASFSAAEEGSALEPGEQLAVTFGDTPFGDPARSSTRYESDIAPVKPFCEVLVNGTAHAPEGRTVREMQVGLQIGAVRKVLNVMGDRVRDAGGYGEPQPFATMPITYERAFGGTTAEGQADMRNPVGIGYRGAASADPAIRSQAPNITYPGEPSLSPADRPRPAGFGALGRGWQPRIGFAGTYDQAWLDAQWPLPPKDIDPRSYLCSPEDQRTPALQGGEEATLVGMTPSGRWRFRLPRVVAPLRLVFDDRMEERAFSPDTLVVEPDLRRVTLKSRFSLVTRRGAPPLREIVFGHVSPGLLMAKRKRKAYLSLQGDDGTLRAAPAWLP